jgi:signal transduction histidine kinase
MSAERSVRIRMIVVFCVTSGVLLAVSYAGSYVVFQRALRSHFDRRLSEIASPVIADLSADPDDKDVDALNIPDEYFEVIDRSGHVLQRSLNLPQNLPLTATAGFYTLRVPDLGEIRATVIPFQAGPHSWFFVAAGSTKEVDESLGAMRRFALILLPTSLLLTAAVFGFYSNYLLGKIDAVVGQLRQFVSDASHELRTPLAVLRGETDLVLSRERSTEEYVAAARVTDSELKRLSRIVDGLFTLSMADAGHLRIAAEPVYLEEVLEESCSLATPMARQKRILIDRDFERGILFNGDPTFLRQLFLVFLDNAIKYSAADSRVRVSLAKQDQVRVRFEDSGIGIARENLSRIFDRFFRAGPSSESHSGGLGLAIAQAIVQAHHGTIECESQLGIGSSFTITLPS